MTRIYTILAGVGFLVGVAIGPWWPVFNWAVYAYLIISLMILALFWQRYWQKVWLFMWLIIFVVLGAWRWATVQNIPNTDVSRYAGQVVTVQGIIVDDPQISSDAVKFTLLAKSINDSQPVTGRILVKARRYPEYSYGNLLTLTGKLEGLNINDEESGYTRYLSRYNIFTTCDYPEIGLNKEFVGHPLWRWLYQIKHYFLQIANQTISEPAAGLLAGLLLGGSSALPSELVENFNVTGLTHIIALSGFNISIVAGAVLGLLLWLPFSIRLSSAIIVVWLFVLLTGAAPSAVRAGLMGMLILLANLTGRLADVTISLVLTAALMILANPKILAYDVGFQLSFLATIGIIYLNPVLQQIFQRLWLGLRGAMCPTLAALIMVTPILAINFGRVSLVAPFTNILVVPLVPLAMLLGFWAVVGGIINPNLGMVLGWLAWLPLKLVVMVADYLGDLPWASIKVELSSGIWVMGYYFIIIGFLIWYYAKTRTSQFRHSG